MPDEFVLAITGASGSVYGVRLLATLLEAGHTVHLTISPSGAEVVKQELGVEIALDRFRLEELAAADPFGAGTLFEAGRGSAVRYHHYQDYSAPIASGSHLTSAMVICPCSMSTLAGVANGLSSNLIGRAADVHLKERRRLLLVPRETPLSAVQLANMQRASEAGAVVLPAMPGFYHRPTSILELVDFVVGRVCDQLGVKHELLRRWGTKQ